MTRSWRKPPRRGLGSYSEFDDDPQAPIETVEIEAKILRRSDAAIEIDTGKEKVDPETGEITPDPVWLPKSQVTNSAQAIPGTTVTLVVREWIAKKKGLI